jgi:hypothetical protein
VEHVGVRRLGLDQQAGHNPAYRGHVTDREVDLAQQQDEAFALRVVRRC